jgi:steroid 5-alpha reductase family enzyme
MEVVEELLRSPLGATFTVASVCAVGCWVLQVATQFFSYVDMLWSVLPVIFALMQLPYSTLDYALDARALLQAALILLWGTRLTLNFARKGGYAGVEDYRWAILRKFAKQHDPFHPVLLELFSFLFVAMYQILLIWAFSALPVWQVAQFRSKLNAGDLVCFAGALVALAAETWTDEEQHTFQTKKYSLSEQERAAAGGDLARGFCTSGPFRFSRHLNFFAEQSFWCFIYGFSVAAGAPFINSSGVGTAALVLLFQGSTWMTELVSVSKYPAYRAFQLTTSRLVPWFPGPALDSLEGERLLRQTVAAGARGPASSKVRKA